MARIKTVCMNCGNITMAGNGSTIGGDYADAKLVYINACSQCTKSTSKKSGCAGLILSILSIMSIVSIIIISLF